MHDTSAIDSTTIRIGTLTAAAAISVLALGFASVPQVFYWLGAAVLAVLLTIITGPKGSNSALSLPMTGLLVVPALCTLVVRETSLIWAVVPVLAFVVAAATWMVATNRYAAMHDEATDTTVAETDAPETTTVMLSSKRSGDEKAAAANDDTSATAA
jgi:hypothetical protein